MIHHITITDNQGTRYRYLMHTQYQERANQLVELDYMTRDAITIERDSDSLYKPYKCSRATTRLYTDSILSLLPAYGHRNICGIIQREERGEWVTIFQGICTDNTYNQGYVSEYDTFELQYQDLLSTLRYVPFDPSEYDNRQNWTFYDLLITALKKVGGYRDVYITDVLNTNTERAKNIFETLTINKANLIDEGDKSKNWSYLEIVEEMCKYLNLSIIPEGDKVYILSYDAIRAGYNWYNHYEVDMERRGNDDPRNAYLYPSMSLVYNHVGRVLLYDHIELSAKHIASNDTNITIQGQTERIVVKCELNPYDRVSPDYDNPDHYIVSQSHSTLSAKEYSNMVYLHPQHREYSYQERYMLMQDGKGNIIEHDEPNNGAYDSLYVSNPRIVSDGGNDEDVLVVRSYDTHKDFNTSTIQNDTNELYIRFLQPDYAAKNGISMQRKGYRVDGTRIVEDMSIYEPSNITYDRLLRGDTIGVYPIQHTKISTSKPEERAKLDKVAYLITNIGKYPNRDNPYTRNEPILTLNIPNVPYANNKYLLINMDWTAYLGKLLMSNNPTDFQSHPKFARVGLYIKLGQRYWNGDKWVKTRTICHIPLDTTSKDERPFGKTYKLKNTILAKHFVGDKRGYHIPLFVPTDPRDTMVFDELSIEIPIPHWWHTFAQDTRDNWADFERVRSNNFWYVNPESIVLSNLSVEVLSKTKTRYTEQEDDDTAEYANLVLYPQYETAEPIELRLSSNTSAQHNKSTVYQSYLGEQYRLKSIYNKANGELLTAEQHIIANHLRQYETPTITLSSTLLLDQCNPKPYTTFGYKHIGRDKIMITNSISVDCVDSKISVEMIEKK